MGRIDAPNNDERMYMTTISSRNRAKKDFLARMIVFTIIIGKALTKEIGGSLSENDILKENHHGQFTGIEDREDLSRIDDQVIGAYDCQDDSMPSTEISLNPPQECRIEDGSAYKKAIKKRAQILEHVRRILV